ncbi:MAG: hypothetical protein JNN32_06830 [Flavobacteriales bacterium]|nr:hypothetical protein [Flavobacteriales bacterium]
MNGSLDALLHTTLTTFAHSILHTPWYGKEREAVSYYAFNFLAKAAQPGTPFYDAGQLAMEGRMPGGPLNTKKQVCKDLVIWPAPGVNCWNEQREAVRYPLVVMEWKANSNTLYPYDLEQLASLTAHVPGMLGVAVTFDAKKKEVLRAAKVLNGEVEEEWLVVEANKG